MITVCQTLVQNKLISGLAGLGIDGSAIANGGATSLRSFVPAEQLPLVLKIYNNVLGNVWYLALALATLTFVSGLGYEWKNVKEEEEKAKRAKEERA